MPGKTKDESEGMSGISSFQTHRESRELQKKRRYTDSAIDGDNDDGDHLSSSEGDKRNQSWNEEDSYSTTTITIGDCNEIQDDGKMRGALPPPRKKGE